MKKTGQSAYLDAARRHGPSSTAYDCGKRCHRGKNACQDKISRLCEPFPRHHIAGLVVDADEAAAGDEEGDTASEKDSQDLDSLAERPVLRVVMGMAGSSAIAHPLAYDIHDHQVADLDDQ